MTCCNLSEGALEVIMRGGDYHQPVLQILGIKRVTSGSADKQRHRIMVSDGKHSVSFAMLTTQIIEQAGPITPLTVIKVERFITSMVNNSGREDQRVLLILDMHIVAPGDQFEEKIGSPTPLEIRSNDESTRNGGASNGYNAADSSTGSRSINSNTTVTNSINLNSQITHPISSLSPYHNKWVIKARVTNKSSIRTWSNSKGEGKLFSMDLIDESGEIRLTAFRDSVDKFYDYIQVDKVYYISKCMLKPANKQFSTLKNDYEMTMTSETVIQECLESDVSSIPQTKYDFVTIDKISSLEQNTMVDVIGVVKSVSDLQTFQARSTGREMKKKEVLLVDQTNTAVTLTLWGADAENFDGTNNPVVVIKCGRISEFGGGKSISSIGSTNIKINPDMKECYRIRGWYDSEGSNIETTNISARSGLGNFSAPWMSFKEVTDQGLGNGERGDYYQVMGTILLIRTENAIYKACPTPDCNKKIIDMENQMYRCEKCNREFPNFKYRLLASMNVGDWSGNQWVSMFSSEVEKVLGMTSQEVGEQIEQDSEAMAAIADKVHFKQFVMKCRAKMETYNDETRLKTVCIKVDPINYEEYNAHLIGRIQQLTN
ncbi:replication protein A 70 kDa DNA-binding subunit [Anoplophora glabripennis]|nr:replication protein A 70 kDa DNA-binding subunit [Anoplophora glabripennis]